MIIAYIIGIVFFLFSFGLLILMLVGRFYGKKREMQLTAWAQSVGMTYQHKDEGQQFANRLGDFAIGSDSEIKGAMHLMRGEGGGFKTTIFDYYRHLDKKRVDSRILISVVLFESPTWHWATTHLKPKKLPEDAPVLTQFEELYDVTDKEVIRNNEALQKHLIQHPEWNVELNNQRMLLYRNGNRAEPNEYQKLLRDALNLKMLIETPQ